MKLIKLLIFFLLFTLTACGTTDSALKDQGRSDSYVIGFHDGRHSGMSEAGNRYDHYIKDESRFSTDPNYKQGWVAGESEGKKLQKQATSIGKTIGGVYSGVQISKEAKKSRDFDKVAEDAVKGVDTTDMDKLGK